jgi:hypothetical protein
MNTHSATVKENVILTPLDESVKFHGRIKGEIGGANETKILNILNAFLIHGMIVQAEPICDH